MSFKYFINTLIAILLATSSNICTAGLIGVSQIRITSSANITDSWLQISEVIAKESITGDDLALTTENASVSSSGNHGIHGSGHSEEKFVIDGVAPGNWFNNEIYHSDSSNSAWLTVDLATPSELDSITLFGRTDCCSYRDIYSIELFNVHGGSLFSAENLSANNVNHLVSINLPVTSVPTPAAFWLFASGFIGFLGMHKNNSTK